jgi:hypothetical protein
MIEIKDLICGQVEEVIEEIKKRNPDCKTIGASIEEQVLQISTRDKPMGVVYLLNAVISGIEITTTLHAEWVYIREDCYVQNK